MRYTRKDVEAAFTSIMRTIGGDYNICDPYSMMEAVPATDGDYAARWRYVIGRFALDYAACYGGYRIVRCANVHGGEHEVTRLRMPARQFCEAARFMADVLAERENGR